RITRSHEAWMIGSSIACGGGDSGGKTSRFLSFWIAAQPVKLRPTNARLPDFRNARLCTRTSFRSEPDYGTTEAGRVPICLTSVAACPTLHANDQNNVEGRSVGCRRSLCDRERAGAIVS